MSAPIKYARTTLDAIEEYHSDPKLSLTLPTPPREGSYRSILELRHSPISHPKVGLIGLGRRGLMAVERLARLEGCSVVALCDQSPEQIAKAQELLRAFPSEPIPSCYSSPSAWRELCEQVDIDLVYICTDWLSHTEIALYAMQCGHHVAIEVPAALNLDEIWALVDTAERTQRYCIQLENCLYDYFELHTLNMVEQGLFGEVVHVEGAYLHSLQEIFESGSELWRLHYNQSFRGDLYATHGLGPACRVLRIGQQDWLDSLVAMDTKPFTGKPLYERLTGKPVASFANGDQTDTLLRTALGKTIHLSHNIMTPQPYSRAYNITGTEGYASKYPSEQLYLRRFAEEGEPLFLSAEVYAEVIQQYHSPVIREVAALYPQYDEWGGKNFIMDYRLIRALQRGIAPDTNVYDLADWCAIGELSRLSIEYGNIPIRYPDFTRTKPLS